MKISEYPAITSVVDDNVLVVDGNAGTKKMKIVDAMLGALHLISPNNHRNILRGKNLGTVLTTEQKASIQEGTFEDLWLGDYWVINGHNWRIVDFDYWYNVGEQAFTSHHLVIMPDGFLYTHVMNDTNTTAGGYVGSKMYKSGLADAEAMVRNAFGDAVLTHQEYLINAVTSGHPSAGDWYDRIVDLPNEPMMYGCYINVDAGSAVKRHTASKSQLALFRNCPKFLDNRTAYWLRDVSSTVDFANVGYYGSATFGNATNLFGVRPVFAIGAKLV